MVTYTLKDGRVFALRAAAPEDAAQVLAYVEQVSGESDFLAFGPGEFDLSEAQEAAFLRDCLETPNRLYLVGFLGGELVATIQVMASHRSRLCHRGELGMSVGRACWGLGIGALMLDHVVTWAQENPVLTKLDLRVRVDNTRAIALYRARAFVEEGVLRKQISVDGECHDLLAMGMDV